MDYRRVLENTLILLIVSSTIVFAGAVIDTELADNPFLVETRYGYVTDNQNRVITWAQLTEGMHKIEDGYTYHEVSSEEEMKAHPVYNTNMRKWTREEIMGGE